MISNTIKLIKLKIKHYIYLNSAKNIYFVGLNKTSLHFSIDHIVSMFVKTKDSFSFIYTFQYNEKRYKICEKFKKLGCHIIIHSLKGN